MKKVVEEIQLVTRMKIRATEEAAFQAFVDPEQIGHFWFSGSSERWTPGATVTLRYEEYDAVVIIRVISITPNERICFEWGEDDYLRTVEIAFKPRGEGIVVTVTEIGWREGDALMDNLISSKEGWTYMLTCLKGFLESGVSTLRDGIVI